MTENTSDPKDESLLDELSDVLIGRAIDAACNGAVSALMHTLGMEAAAKELEKHPLFAPLWKAMIERREQSGGNGAASNSEQLSARESRRRAFNARIDELTLSVAKGGGGLSFNDAIALMRATPQDAALIALMEKP